MRLDLSEMSPKLRRAFFFIEDEDWGRAEEYLESVLDEEPENPYANLGMAMIKVRVDSPFELTDKEIESLKRQKAYSRAEQYADDNLKKLFSSWDNRSSDSTPQPQSAKYGQKSGQMFLVEAEDGTLVDVPADRLNSWSKAQAQRDIDQELTPREKELSDAVLEKIYAAPKEKTSSQDADRSGKVVETAPSQPPNPQKKHGLAVLLVALLFAVGIAAVCFSIYESKGAAVQPSSANTTENDKTDKDDNAMEVEPTMTQEEAYAEMQRLYRNGNLTDARRILTTLGSYKDADKYLILLDARHNNFCQLHSIDELLDIFDFEDAADLLVNNKAVAQEFLKGDWTTTDGRKSFKMDQNGAVSYNLWDENLITPDVLIIDNGVLSQREYGLSQEAVQEIHKPNSGTSTILTNLYSDHKILTIQPLSRDSIKIVSADGNSTYVLNKK